MDAETGELHDTLSTGQREYDLELARLNIAGELMDLQAGGMLDETMDPLAVSDVITERYHSLWTELTVPESFERGERWRVDARIRRLNDLGFDVGELTIATDVDGTSVQHRAQGRRRRPPLPAAAAADRASTRARTRPAGCSTTSTRTARPPGGRRTTRSSSRTTGCTECFEPVVRAVPRDLRGKLEPAEIYHEVLEHRWYLSEQRGHDVGLSEALQSYVRGVLVHKPDEEAVLGVDTQEMPVVADE